MTLKEFVDTNWHRGNVVKLSNGKEYFLKGIKGHGRWLLLHSAEYNKCFIADHNIVDCRTSDYEEPEEIYLEKVRRKQAEYHARQEAEKQERLRLKQERKQKNLQEQERIHLEALARKAARINEQLQLKKQKEAKQKEARQRVAPQPVEKPNDLLVKAAPLAPEQSEDQPKRKRQRIKIKRVEKVEIK